MEAKNDSHFKVYSWGINANGQLGIGKTTKEEFLPQIVKTLKNVK